MNGEHVREIAIVGLRPEMSIGAGVDELSIDTDAIGGALNAAFQHMGNTELTADLAKIAGANGLILHDTGAADYFEVCNLRQIGENFVLDAVGEKGGLLICA